MKKERITKGRYTFTRYGDVHSKKGVIMAVGNSDEGLIVKGAAKYFNSLGCDVIALPLSLRGEKYDGVHSFPIDIYGEAIAYLKERGVEKIGIGGASTTAMMSLAAASVYPEISLCLLYTGSDFIFEGNIVTMGKSGKLTDRKEVPAHGQSALSFRGEDMPYSPYGLDDEKYDELAYGSVKKYGELNGLELFDITEANPDFERGYIKAENSHARIVAFSAEDDVRWRTVKYMTRLEKRLADAGYKYGYELHTYEYGTHFIYPQGLLMSAVNSPQIIRFALGRIFKSAKRHAAECQQTREDVGRITEKVIAEW